VALLTSGTAEAEENAAMALGNLADGHLANKTAIAAADAIPALAALVLSLASDVSAAAGPTTRAR